MASRTYKDTPGISAGIEGKGSEQSYGAGRTTAVLVLLAVVLLAVFVGSLFLGRYDVHFGDVALYLAGLIAGNTPPIDPGVGLFLSVRFPRVLAALLIGAALSAAGASYQGIFVNPMVSPDILGASAGACFGAALGILLSLNNVGVEMLAFACGVVAVAISWGLASLLSRHMGSVLVLILAGLVVGNVFQAGISSIKFLADPNSQLPEITFWLMGGLNLIRDSDLLVLAITCLLGCGGLFALRWRINVMSFGDEEATSLGVDVKRDRLLTVGFATLLTAASVALAGMVGWIGLIVPHLARFLVGPDNRVLIPASIMLGGAFLMIVDDLCRSIYTTEIPLSILTAFIGAPLFVYLIYRQRRS